MQFNSSWVCLSAALACGLVVGCTTPLSNNGDASTAMDAGAVDGAHADGGSDTSVSAADTNVPIDAFALDGSSTLDAASVTDAGVDACTVATATTCRGRCGNVLDAHCNVFVDCGDHCVAPETCGGGAMGATFCACTDEAMATTCAGRCGTVTNNCGRSVDCGNTCTGANTCGGGGTPNTCGCTDDGTACNGQVCGTAINNCGTHITCGRCPAGFMCCGDSCARNLCP